MKCANEYTNFMKLDFNNPPESGMIEQLFHPVSVLVATQWSNTKTNLLHLPLSKKSTINNKHIRRTDRIS